MRQAIVTLEVETRGRGFTELTAPLRRWVGDTGIADGLLTVFIRHTSASLLIQENADPDVRVDLETWLAGAVEDGDPRFVHTLEGDDDMAAHVRTALTQTHLSIPVRGGVPVLGTWQGVYVWEHRARPHRRAVVLHLIGE